LKNISLGLPHTRASGRRRACEEITKAFARFGFYPFPGLDGRSVQNQLIYSP